MTSPTWGGGQYHTYTPNVMPHEPFHSTQKGPLWVCLDKCQRLAEIQFPKVGQRKSLKSSSVADSSIHLDHKL